MFLKICFLLICLSNLVHSQKSKIPPLPSFLVNTSECPLNACEVIKLLSQYFLISKNSEEENIKENVHGFDISTSNVFLEKRVREIERRLKSIEQPVWKIIEENDNSWNHCTEGFCRCRPATKSLSCWKKNLKILSVSQTIPTDIVSM